MKSASAKSRHYFRLMMLSALVPASGAWAQTAAVPADETAATDPQAPIVREGEILVTAQRRSERLQDVPIAITALNSESLERRNVTNIESLVGTVPSLSITNSAGVSASNLITIRGIAGQPLPIGASQAVAIYLDGVYIARPDGAIFALDDVERVEVLRGPQGTLYGRNATAGAINIITRAPSTTVRGGVSLRYGNFNAVDVKGSWSGPLGGGLSVGVSGSVSRRDGYFLETFTNQRTKGAEFYTIRGTLRYLSPDSALDVRLSGDYSSVSNPSYVKFINPNASFPNFGDPDTVSTEISNLIKQDVEHYGVSLTMDYAASDSVSLTSITAYRDLETGTIFDANGSAAPAGNVGIVNTATTFMQELRANLTGSGWRATIGANYFREDATLARAVNPANYNILRDPYDTSKLDAYAAFAQVEVDVVPTVTLVGGLRYNREERDFTIDYTARGPAFFFPGSLSDDEWIPSVGVNFKPSSDILFYAKASKGYQAPGFEYSGGPGAGARTFTSETLWAYEVGLKSQLFDRLVVFDVAAFYYDYKDIQVRNSIATGINAVQNAAAATIKGVEVGLTIRPTRYLSFGGNFSYLDAQYGEFCQPISGGTPRGSDPLCPNGRADRSGNRLNLAPEWSGNLFATLAIPAGDGEIRGNANYAWESNSFYTSVNSPAVATGGWHSVDARLGYKMNGGPEIYVFGKNLTNERYIAYAAQSNDTNAAGAVSAPQTYGIGLNFRF